MLLLASESLQEELPETKPRETSQNCCCPWYWYISINSIPGWVGVWEHRFSLSIESLFRDEKVCP